MLFPMRLFPVKPHLRFFFEFNTPLPPPHHRNSFPDFSCAAVWVGGWSPSKDHCLLDSVTGAIMECFSPPAGNAWGGYGCLVDSVNVLWGAGGYGNYQLFRKAPGQAPTAVGGIPNYVYGLGLDKRTCSHFGRCCVGSRTRRRQHPHIPCVIHALLLVGPSHYKYRVW